MKTKYTNKHIQQLSKFDISLADFSDATQRGITYAPSLEVLTSSGFRGSTWV